MFLHFLLHEIRQFVSFFLLTVISNLKSWIGEHFVNLQHSGILEDLLRSLRTKNEPKTKRNSNLIYVYLILNVYSLPIIIIYFKNVQFD